MTASYPVFKRRLYRICRTAMSIVPDLNIRPRQLVFLTPIDSQLNDFLNDIHQIACLAPFFQNPKKSNRRQLN